MELSSTAGAKQVHEVHVGGNATPRCDAGIVKLAEAKSVLAGLQRHLVQAQAEEHFPPGPATAALDVGGSGR